VSLQGAIEELGLCELIQALTLNRSRGTLRIEPDGAPSKFFYFDAGEIVLLRSKGGETARAARSGDRPFEEEFLDVFLLDRGQFEFIFGPTPEALFPSQRDLERIALNTQSLMLEAMRRVDDWHALVRAVGSLDEIYERKVPLPLPEEPQGATVRLTQEQRFVVGELLDGQRSLREVLAAAQGEGASRLATLQFVVAVKGLKAIARLDEATYLTRLANALSTGDVDVMAKLIRCLVAKGPIEPALVEQYIDFVRSSGRTSLARSEAKLLGAHYFGRGEVNHAISLYTRAFEIDPRDTEVLDRLFYAHLKNNNMEKALALAGPVRDAMARDRDLPTVARLVKNLKELAPRDARVLELSGLLARRQDRLEEARTDLEAALAASENGRSDSSRRMAIKQALSEVDPRHKKDSGSITRSSDTKVPIVPRGTTRIVRSRRPSVALALVLLGAFFLSEELRARSELARADRAAAAEDSKAKLTALGLYTAASGRLSTVASRAASRAEALRGKLAAPPPAPPPPPGPATPATPTVTDTDFEDYEAARPRQAWALAAKLALKIHASNDSRRETVRMPIRVATRPVGALVECAAARPGNDPPTTPCVIEVPVGASVKIKVHKAGFVPRELAVSADEFHELSVDLDRGPAWRRDLDSPVEGVAIVQRTAVVLAGSSILQGFSLDDGSPVFDHPLEGGDALGPAPAQNLVLAGQRSGKVVAVDLKGAEKWRTTTKPLLFAPQAVDIDQVERAVVTTSDALVVVDLAAGKVLREIPLVQPPIAPPVLRPARAWVLLADGSIACFDTARGLLMWSVSTKAQVAGGPIYVPGTSTLYATTRDGSVLAIGAADGNTLWRRPTRASPVELAPAADETRILVPSSGRLAAVDGRDGKPIWDQACEARGAPLRLLAHLYLPGPGELLELEPSSGTLVARYPFDGGFVAMVASGAKLVVASGRSVQSFDRGE
jgi:tetratricopeptide (TPR) repeat protein